MRTLTSRLFAFALLALLAGFQGCSGPDSESAANQKFKEEMNKWIAGETSEASTMQSRITTNAPPVGYDIKSVVKDKGNFAAHSQGVAAPKNSDELPAFRFNVDIEYKSQAGTPLHKVTTYTLTWNPEEKKWFINERF